MKLDALGQLDEMRHDAIGATDVADVARIQLQLIAWLEAWSLAREERDAILLQLLREAYNHLANNPKTTLDVRDWLRTAAPFIRS